MNSTPLWKKLRAAAKAIPVDDSVPPGFERRVMARMRAASRLDAWAWWAESLWRGALASVVLAAVVSATTWWPATGSELGMDFYDDLEQTILAPGGELETGW
ncbi:MAG TPA: hypothetical protein VNO52_12955 [Methylomirabilota bacterium]|nr:hypothetical protein [Methylomirabilota bacterium]